MSLVWQTDPITAAFGELGRLMGPFCQRARRSALQVLATKAGALKCAPLAVSGAFHTRLMEPARDQLVKVPPLFDLTVSKMITTQSKNVILF